MARMRMYECVLGQPVHKHFLPIVRDVCYAMAATLPPWCGPDSTSTHDGRLQYKDYSPSVPQVVHGAMHAKRNSGIHYMCPEHTTEKMDPQNDWCVPATDGL